MILGTIAAITASIRPEPPVVCLTAVAKTYQAGSIQVPALRNVRLSISANRFSMLIGKSGSGKTTLLNLIGCIDSPSQGSVEVCGQKVADLADNELSVFRARNIGFICQNFSLIPVLSAFENVEYPLLLIGMPSSERRDRALAMLQAVGLEGQAGQRPNELSGGQKQRVAIARALVKSPQLVLADEPTANLDTSTGAAIIDLMRRVQAKLKTTFIFATHDQQLMSHADERFVISDGEIVDHKTVGLP